MTKFITETTKKARDNLGVLETKGRVTRGFILREEGRCELVDLTSLPVLNKSTATVLNS